MKALLLAAGYATRLYPLTQDRPKSLLDVAGRPVIEYILAQLQKIEDVDTIYIAVNHKFLSQFEKWKAGYQAKRLLVLVDDGSTHEENRLGAVGDMDFCIRTQRIAEDLLIVAGDNLFDMALGPFVQFAERRTPFASMMVYDVKDFVLARHYGIVGLDAEKRIVSFEEKPPQPKSTLSAMGVYYFPQKVHAQLQAYLKEGSLRDAPGFFIRWLSQKETVYGYPCEGIWYDIGDLDSLKRASEAFGK
ncbi:MAG: nucleotidyltransferase family protein [Candidatus Omnitrophota bacterium]